MLVASPFNSFTPPHFILTVKTDNSGVSNSNQFTLPTVVGRTYDYQIDWGDGTVEYYTTDAPQTHTYAAAGTYEIQIYGTFPGVNFVFGQPVDFGKVIKIKDLGRVGWGGNIRLEQLINLTEITNPGDTSGITFFAYFFRGNSSLTSFPLINTSNGTSFSHAWFGCSSLTSFPLIDTSNGTNFGNAWFGCSSLTSFPLIDTSNGTNFYSAWRNCSSLTSFPLINTSNGTSFSHAWFGCSSLTSFPLIDTSNGTNFGNAWNNCPSLTSFPLIDTSNGTSFYAAWFGCSSLTSFPLINTSNGTSFYAAWYSCTSLTSFPLINTGNGTDFGLAWNGCTSLTTFPPNFFDTWVGVPVNQCFRYTWNDCSALTAQSVENILVSIDVSGVNAPGGATAGDNYIEIDYNVSTGGLTATTNTAITNLKGKGWEPFINGVLV